MPTKNKKSKSSQKKTVVISDPRVKQLEQQVAKLKVNKKNTPFADVGGHLGNMFGLKNLGRTAGGFIGKILGSGDYTTNFPSVQENQLTAQVPAFMGDTVITHREFIQDVISSPTAGAFTSLTGPLNPGQPALFPWLATIAQNYEEYEILGMIFEFKSMSGQTTSSSNTALGSVILATLYDPTKPAFATKAEMENYEFAQSCKPSESVMHAVECKKVLTPVKSLYVRTTPSSALTDLRWTDFGNFTIATVGLPGTNVNVGELWVSYKIALRKPRLPATPGGYIAQYFAERTGVDSTHPFGTGAPTDYGSLKPTSISATVLSIVLQPQTLYYFSIFWTGGAVTWTSPAVTLSSGISTFAWSNNGSGTYFVGPETGQVAKQCGIAFYFRTNTSVASTQTITLSAAGFLPSAITGCEIFLSTIDDSLSH